MEHSHQLEARLRECQAKLANCEKVNRVLMNRVERGIDSTGDAFSLFESNILLQDTINERTQELARANERLQRSNVELQHEILERQRIESELRAFTARLEASNRELEEFASVASHDLQEPLRKVQAFGDRLTAVCGDDLSEKARDYLARMQSAAGRMQTLIEDLLVFSRVTSTGKPFVEVELTKTAEAVVSDLEVTIERSGGCVSLGELPIVEADPLQMRQLLQNLICNGLKFRKEGEPPLVKVYCETDTPEQPREGEDATNVVRLIVEDNGIGFDEKYLDKVFGIFQRLHSRSEYEGTGIGLAVCRKIARRHGGDVTASSTPGEGAKFTVMLPRQHNTGVKDDQSQRESDLHPVSRG